MAAALVAANSEAVLKPLPQPAGIHLKAFTMET